jgi:AraC-like DNA-binding protein
MTTDLLTSDPTDARAILGGATTAGHWVRPRGRDGADHVDIRAIVRMRRDDASAFSLHVSHIQIGQAANTLDLDRLQMTERADEAPQPDADARGIAVSTAGEFRWDGATPVLVLRLPAPPHEGLDAPDHRPAPGLPKWRLKRATHYIEANIGEPVSLGDLANAAGLSPAYFAAQFRIATGLRPHEYLLRRRIHHAQRMLLDHRTSIIEIALSVGFQTQAHFTTVFKRFVGQPPLRWRQLNAAAA